MEAFRSEVYAEMQELHNQVRDARQELRNHIAAVDRHVQNSWWGLIFVFVSAIVMMLVVLLILLIWHGHQA